MAEGRVGRTLLKYEVDRASVSSAIKSVQAIERSFAHLEGEVASTSNSTKDVKAQLESLKRIQSVNTIAREFAQLAARERDANIVLKDFRKGLMDIGASWGEVQRGTEEFKRLYREALRAQDVTRRGFSPGQMAGIGTKVGRAGLGVVAKSVDLSPELVGNFLVIQDIMRSMAPASAALASGFTGLVGAFAPMLAVVIPVATALIGVSKALEAVDIQAKTVTSTLGSRRRNFGESKDIADSTTEESLSALTSKAQDRAELEAEKSFLKAELERTFLELSKQQGDLGARIAFSRDEEVNKTIARIKEVEQAILDLERLNIDTFRKIQEGSTAIADAEAAQVKAGQDLIRTLQEGEAEFRLFEEISKQSAETLRDRETALQRDISLMQVQKDLLEASGNSTQAVTDEIARLDGALKSAESELNKVSDVLDKKLAAAARKFVHDSAVTQQEERRKAFADQLKAEKDFRDKQVADIVSVQQRYEDSVQSIEDQAAEQRTAIHAKYADKVTEILEKEIADSEAALARAEENLANLLERAAKDEEKIAAEQAEEDLQAQIEEQRAQRDQLVEHLRRVRDIERQYRAQERDALLDRNFLALFQIQENKKEQLSEEEQANREKSEDRQRALEEERNDLARQRAIAKADRQAALIEQLQENAEAYTRELELIAAAKTKALDLALDEREAQLGISRDTTKHKLEILRQGYIAELTYANLGAQARIKADEAVNAAYLARANATIAALGGIPSITSINPATTLSTGVFSSSSAAGGIQYFGDGGTFTKGQIFAVNDKFRNQRETVNGTRMPPGVHYLASTAPGSVNARGSGGGNTYAPVFHVNGDGLNASAVVGLIERKFNGWLNRLLD